MSGVAPLRRRLAHQCATSWEAAFAARVSMHAAPPFFRRFSAVPLINLEPLPSQTAQRGRLRLFA